MRGLAAPKWMAGYCTSITEVCQKAADCESGIEQGYLEAVFAGGQGIHRNTELDRHGVQAAGDVLGDG